jgi:hypothetical protein
MTQERGEKGCAGFLQKLTKYLKNKTLLLQGV